MHECEFADGDPIFAPLPSHSVKTILQEEQRKRHWMALSACVTVPVLAAGLYYYMGRGKKKPSTLCT